MEPNLDLYSLNYLILSYLIMSYLSLSLHINSICLKKCGCVGW